VKNLYYLIICFSVICFLSCSETVNNSATNFYKVSGKLIQGGLPFSGATVSINNSDVLKSLSDSTGFFEIINVPSGNHTLNINKVNSDGSFYSKSSPIIVQSDIIFDHLILPKGVWMYPLSVSGNSISLYWTPTDANDFREYKVYRGTTSGLDETTGELIHISTTINDTSFVDDDLPTGFLFFYRVYVMNEYGRLGGSNIESAMTENSNIILNSSFEEVGTDGEPINWSTVHTDTLWDFTLYSGINSHTGTNAMKGFTTVISVWPLDGYLEQRISSYQLIPGEEYVFSFWYNIDTLVAGNLQVDLTINKSTGEYIFLESGICENPTYGWVKYSIEFTAPQTNPQDYFLRYIHRSFGTGQHYKIWIDDVELKRIL